MTEQQGQSNYRIVPAFVHPVDNREKQNENKSRQVVRKKRFAIGRIRVACHQGQ
jgi:hypothetical protein